MANKPIAAPAGKPQASPASAPKAPVLTAEQRASIKRSKLLELASKRVTIAIQRIRLVGNLYAYGPTPAEQVYIVTALEQAVASAKTRLAGSKTASEGFILRTIG